MADRIHYAKAREAINNSKEFATRQGGQEIAGIFAIISVAEALLDISCVLEDKD